MESSQSSPLNRTIIEVMISKVRDYEFVLSDRLEESMEELKNSMEEAWLV